MASVVFPGTGGIEPLIVDLRQPFTPPRILPDPIAEGILYRLLFLLGEYGLLLVEHPRFTGGGRVRHRIEYAYVLEVQRLLDYLVCVYPVGPVGDRSRCIGVIRVLIGQMPFGCNGRILNLYPSSCPIGRRQQLVDKALDYIHRQPCSAEADVYIGCGKLGRLHLFKRSNVHRNAVKLAAFGFIARRG